MTRTYSTLFLLFILPFLVIPFGVSYFEAPKVIIAEVVIELTLSWVFIRSDNEHIWKIKRFSILVLSLLAFLSIIHLLFYRTDTTLLGNQFRLQGVFLLWHLLLFSLLAKKILPNTMPLWFFPVIASLQVIATVFSPTTLDGRSVGTLGEPNALAAFAVFLLPWIFFRRDLLKGIRVIILITVISIIIVMSGSRSGIIAFGLELLLLLLVFQFRFSLQRVFIVGLFVLALSFILPFVEKNTGQLERRSDVWKAAWQAGWDRPIIGWGFGNVETAILTTSERYDTIVRYQYVDSSHNVFLDWWVQGGVLGVLGFLGFLGNALKQFIRQNAQLELILLLGVLVILSFNPVSVVTLLEFWYLMGRSYREERK